MRKLFTFREIIGDRHNLSVGKRLRSLLERIRKPFSCIARKLCPIEWLVSIEFPSTEEEIHQTIAHGSL